VSWDNLIYALDPVAWVRSLDWHPDPWQTEMLESSSKRICLNVARQSGKSSCTAAIALHSALFTPEAVVLIISPSLRQSIETFNKVKGFLARVPDRPPSRQDSATQLQLQNNSRIIALPGTGDSIRSFSADVIILDEAARIDDSVIRAVTPMLATKSNGRMLVLSTPGLKSGYYYEKWTNGGKSWHRIKATVEDCPRITQEFLDEERASMSEAHYRAEFYGEFLDADDMQWLSTDLIDALVDPTVRPLWPRYREIETCASSATP
jgi:hypothetical protein